MLLTPRDRRVSSSRWLAAAGLVAALTPVTGLVLRPFIQDPMPANWLMPGQRDVVMHRDSPEFFVFAFAGLLVFGVGAAVACWASKRSLGIHPLPGRSTFLLVAMNANLAVLGWLRPDVFSGWLASVYLALLAGLILNHIRESRWHTPMTQHSEAQPQALPPEPATPSKEIHE